MQTVEGETVLEGTGHTWAYLDEGEWSGCTLWLSFQIIEGTVHVNFLRSADESGQKRYFAA
ncbi:MAG TPA: hypothetical protein VN540_00930 [Clostridia bacterium]|nr:hypothetical protein [Clostridia bacterium]